MCWGRVVSACTCTCDVAVQLSKNLLAATRAFGSSPAIMVGIVALLLAIVAGVSFVVLDSFLRFIGDHGVHATSCLCFLQEPFFYIMYVPAPLGLWDA